MAALLTNENLESKHYYPFGMVMLGRSWTATSGDGYRFGFNGKEPDSETYGEGNVYDYGFRIYNPRLGKFLSVDPLFVSYPWYTPYQFAGNMPIICIDIDGLEEYGRVVYRYNGIVFHTSTCRVPIKRRALNDEGDRIDQGIAVLYVDLDEKQFNNLAKTGFSYKATDLNSGVNFVDESDILFSKDNIVDDVYSVLTESQKKLLDSKKNNQSNNPKYGGGAITQDEFNALHLDLNFKTDDASYSTVQNSYNTDLEFATKIDIVANLLSQFPSLTISVTGRTDARSSNYRSKNPDNPYFESSGNNPLSYDRARAVANFIAQRTHELSGIDTGEIQARLKVRGMGVAPGATTADSPEEMQKQRSFIISYQGGE